PSMPDYGKLFGQKLEDLESGARVDVNEVKRDPLDFVLWKGQKPGEPAWDSPWGPGRPGWHIECSAMSMKYLGETVDIHCGGVDLIFPHHENEIAQSECATGKPFVNYWMHNNHINVNNEKMSKSLGNFFTVREISEEFDLMAVRLFMLGAHYRSPINFSRELIEQATSALERIRNAVDLLARTDGAQSDKEQALINALPVYRERFIAAMEDDLNTADALSVLFELVREANAAFAQAGSRAGAQTVLAAMKELLDVLGINAERKDEIPAQIQALAEARVQARKEKNWAEADRLRDEITAAGYVVEDSRQGMTIRRA
ncbi:MAG: cysteine--tRNA ligase, partial [Clostridia bacterium]|nr:cysteine--tRNA ligase [Clostridia bacterium]